MWKVNAEKKFEDRCPYDETVKCNNEYCGDCGIYLEKLGWNLTPPSDYNSRQKVNPLGGDKKE